MQSTNIPSKIPLPFAYAAGSGYIEPIPSASQIGITNGKASLHDGFPPLTFTPISAGGVPPFGADFNGILNEITAIQQWQEAGGFFPFDSTFSTTVGGYPKGAVLLSQTFNGFWTSTTENNTSNPDAGGAGWIPSAFEGITPITMSSTSVTLTPLQAAYPIMVVTGTLTANSTIIVPAIPYDWIVSNQTTGSYTLTVKTSSGTGVNIAQGSSQYIWGDGTNVYYANASSVTSFNTRTGAITLTALDVTNALGYTPYNATNPSGYISVGLGINQSWYSTSNSTLTRSLNTTYTNSTGAPICVMIYDDNGPQVYVNGVLIGDNAEGSSDTSTITFIVPNGATYRANGSSANLGYWSELR
jgi:hypothetical protein